MTQAGTQRHLNEDSFQISRKVYPDTLDAFEQKADSCEDYWQIYAVTDGCGGAGVGDIASRLVQEQIIRLAEGFPSLEPFHFSFPDYLRRFLRETDQALRERLSRHAGEVVGASLALLLFAGERCFAMSLGTCAIDLYRQGKLYRMCPGENLRLGERVPHNILGYRPHGQLLQIGGLQQMLVQAEDRFLLMSDGIWQAAGMGEIQWIFNKPAPLSMQTQNIFEHARRNNPLDNQTVLGLEVVSRRAMSDPQPESWQEGENTSPYPMQPGPAGTEQLASATEEAGSTRRLPEPATVQASLSAATAATGGPAGEETRRYASVMEETRRMPTLGRLSLESGESKAWKPQPHSRSETILARIERIHDFPPFREISRYPIIVFALLLLLLLIILYLLLS